MKIKKLLATNQKLLNLSKSRRVRLILKIYKKLKAKSVKAHILKKKTFFKLCCKRLKKYCPNIFNDIKRKKLIKIFKSFELRKKPKLKHFFQNDIKFLSKRFRKLLFRFNGVKYYGSTKKRIQRRVNRMNRITPRKKMYRNLRKRSYFFKIIRKKRRRRLKVFRLNRNNPIFTKKTRKEKKFLLKSRESLLRTKKYLYRKKFPKIKGKKNRNFNFFYYNNMDRAPFKFHIGRIVITYLLNNTFINIHNSKKMLKVISAGKLKFKGPKRSTQYSRQIVARKAINYVSRTQMNVLDIFLNSNYNRWYYFLFKEFSKPKVKPYVIRYLVISNSRPHGFIRDRKHRRK